MLDDPADEGRMKRFCRLLGEHNIPNMGRGLAVTLRSSSQILIKSSPIDLQ